MAPAPKYEEMNSLAFIQRPHETASHRLRPCECTRLFSCCPRSRSRLAGWLGYMSKRSSEPFGVGSVQELLDPLADLYDRYSRGVVILWVNDRQAHFPILVDIRMPEARRKNTARRCGRIICWEFDCQRVQATFPLSALFPGNFDMPAKKILSAILSLV